MLDHVLQWVSDEDRDERGSALHLTPRSAHVLYDSAPLRASNNTAEYEAHVNGLQIAIKLGVRRLDVRGDS